MTDENLTFKEQKATLNRQLVEVQKNFKTGAYGLNDLGSILPAAVIVHDLKDLIPAGVCYMNNWGCERLGSSVEEINSLGEEYYCKYFVPEETHRAFEGISQYLQNGDFSQQYNFFQRVKLYDETIYQWFYSVCKIFQIPENKILKEKMIVLSSPIQGVDNIISKVNKILDENVYIKRNYPIFAILTKREKRIIALLMHGNSSKEIAEELCISIHTVNTHRKNIIRKTECRTFAALLQFAITFDII